MFVILAFTYVPANLNLKFMCYAAVRDANLWCFTQAWLHKKLVVNSTIGCIGTDKKKPPKSLLQRCIVLITGKPKLNNRIAQVIFIDACKCVAKPLISIEEKCWGCFNLKPDHQFLQAHSTYASYALHMCRICQATC